MPCLVRNPKVHFHFKKSPPLVPVHTLTKMHKFYSGINYVIKYASLLEIPLAIHKFKNELNSHHVKYLPT